MPQLFIVARSPECFSLVSNRSSEMSDYLAVNANVSARSIWGQSLPIESVIYLGVYPFLPSVCH